MEKEAEKRVRILKQSDGDRYSERVKTIDILEQRVKAGKKRDKDI